MNDLDRSKLAEVASRLERNEAGEVQTVLEDLHARYPENAEVRILLARSLEPSTEVNRIAELLWPLINEGNVAAKNVMEQALLVAYAGWQYLEAAEYLLSTGRPSRARALIERGRELAPDNAKVLKRYKKLQRLIKAALKR